MITVESLTRTYGRFTAVDDVTFTAQAGRVTGFLGPNGAGKSTTMRVMAGLTPPTSGSATVLGRRYADLPNPGREVGVLLNPPPSTPGAPAARSSPSPSARWACPPRRVPAMIERVSLTRRGRPSGAWLLPRHAAAARHRHRAARRPAGADPRRARQRARPGRHPLDARPAARVRRRRRHRAAVLAPAPRDRGGRRRPRRDRPGPDRGPGRQGLAAGGCRHAGPLTRRRTPGPRKLQASGHSVTLADGVLRTDADTVVVGAVALAAGVALAEACAPPTAPGSRRCSSS